MKKKEIEFENINDTSKLETNDLVVLFRRETYAYGDAYMSLGIVKKTKKETIIDLVSCGYGTCEMDDFLENVELYPSNYDTFTINGENMSRHSAGIRRISNEYINIILERQLKQIDSELSKINKDKEKLINFYRKKVK
jgi:hypothetical protein